VVWPSRGETPSAQLPPAVQTGRIVFESQSGESCCVAVDPKLISGGSQRGLAVLTDLAPGPATVTVAGFTTNYAPTVDGILTTCTTTPPGIAHPCDAVQLAAPAFESDPIFVTIIAGVQTNVPTVEMVSFPFPYAFTPGQDDNAPAPVQFALTVVDAVTNIRADSVGLEVSFTVPVEHPTPGTPPFRSLSKRVPLTLSPCDDGSDLPCSNGGDLDLSGFHATGTAPELPEGEVEAHLTAENLDEPPRGLDFRYSFVVLATATATATATPSSAPPLTPGIAGDGDAAAGSAASAAGSAASEPPSSGRGSAPRSTPTATPTPHPSA
jgi:hypothetical protein